MLFEQERTEEKKFVRPKLPADYKLDFRIGFLFNFVSSKSTRFDLEPVLIYTINGFTEYKRISLSVEKGLAFLHLLDDAFFNDLFEFSDNKLLDWMTRTGNRFLRNHSGSWAHASSRELVNLRKHYRDLLQKLWPALCQWPDVFILKVGRFSNFQQTPIKLGNANPIFKFKVEKNGELIALKMVMMLDGKESTPDLRSGVLLEKDGTLYLPQDVEALSILDLFKNGPLTFPLTVKREIINKYVTPWLEKNYEVTISDKLGVEKVSPEVQPRIMLSELNESNLMIRPQFLYEDVVVDYSEERSHVAESKDKVRIIERNKDEEKKLYEYLRGFHTSFATQRNNQYYYLPFADVMKKGWFISLLRKVQEQGLSVHGWSELKKFRYTTQAPVINIQATSSVDWFRSESHHSMGRPGSTFEGNTPGDFKPSGYDHARRWNAWTHSRRVDQPIQSSS
jgi:hypothetical protein